MTFAICLDNEGYEASLELRKIYPPEANDPKGWYCPNLVLVPQSLPVHIPTSRGILGVCRSAQANLATQLTPPNTYSTRS